MNSLRLHLNTRQVDILRKLAWLAHLKSNHPGSGFHLKPLEFHLARPISSVRNQELVPKMTRKSSGYNEKWNVISSIPALIRRFASFLNMDKMPIKSKWPVD